MLGLLFHLFSSLLLASYDDDDAWNLNIIVGPCDEPSSEGFWFALILLSLDIWFGLQQATDFRLQGVSVCWLLV